MSVNLELVVRAWVALMWADGEQHEREVGVIRRKLLEMGMDSSMLDTSIRRREDPYSIPLSADLHEIEKQLILAVGYLISLSDGDYSDRERVMLERFADRLGVPPDRLSKIQAAVNKTVPSEKLPNSAT